MDKLKVYIDTSVIGGCLNYFSKYSNMLIDKFRDGSFIPVVSKTVREEIDKAPPLVIRKYDEILTYNAIYLNKSDDIENLVFEYLKNRIVSKKWEDDCYHIAFVTINKIDVLLSWNFRHIVNEDKVKLFNFVNKELGLNPIIIKDPKDFLGLGKYDIKIKQ